MCAQEASEMTKEINEGTICCTQHHPEDMNCGVSRLNSRVTAEHELS